MCHNNASRETTAKIGIEKRCGTLCVTPFIDLGFTLLPRLYDLRDYSCVLSHQTGRVQIWSLRYHRPLEPTGRSRAPGTSAPIASRLAAL